LFPTNTTFTKTFAAARYFRFTALREVNGKDCASAAEVSVIAAGRGSVNDMNEP
jgi:hypothetical protein